MRKSVLFCILLFAFSILIGTTYTWNGSANRYWTQPDNWTPVGVPDASDNVIIPSYVVPSRYPMTDWLAECNNLTVEDVTGLYVYNYLHVYGNAVIAGLLYFETGNILRVEGDITWQAGCSLDYEYGITQYMIYCHGNMTFDAGAETDFFPGIIIFSGSDSCILTNHSTSTNIYKLSVEITYPAFLTVSAASTQDFAVNGNIFVTNNHLMKIEYPGSIYLRGNLNASNNTQGGLSCLAGTLVMDSWNADTIAMSGPDSFLNNFRIYHNETVTLSTSLILKGNLSIEHGVFIAAPDSTIQIAGNWVNQVGASAFTESTSRVILNGTAVQRLDYSETFYALQLNNPSGLRIDSGAAVTCSSYDWQAGPIVVNSGSFTVGDLVDNGIYGTWTVYAGGTVNLMQDAVQYVDLNAILSIFGGSFNVYGGSDTSWWPYTNAASLSMNGGVLDFKDRGIMIANGPDFTETITGGLIRTAGQFFVERTDFNPAAGTVEMYGGSDVPLFVATGSFLNKLKINKTMERGNDLTQDISTDRLGNSRPVIRSNTVTCSGTLDLNDDFWLDNGTFVAPTGMSVGGDWINIQGETAFMEGSCKVVFDGEFESNIIGAEAIDSLVIGKSGNGSVSIGVSSSVTCNIFKLMAGSLNLGGGDFTCDSYIWVSGSLNVNGGTYTANDLSDNAVTGIINLTGGRINLYQDLSSYIDLRAALTISGGELHIYGGSGGSYWPYGGSASLSMSNGVIDIHDQLVYIYNSGSFPTNITGGTIRIAGDFWCGRPDFTPSGGSIELYSSADATLNMISGNLSSLIINKSAGRDDESISVISSGNGSRSVLPVSNTRSNLVALSYNTFCSGNISIQSGRLDCNAKILACNGTVTVNGYLEVDAGASLKLAGPLGLTVNSGGRLEVIGTSVSNANITHSTGYYYLDILSGGSIAAEYAIFEYMRTNGVYVQSGALVDPIYSFHFCTFRYGTINGVLLTLDSDQNLLINNAVFPTNTWTGSNNVKKSADAGVVNFAGATGGFSGESYDYDLNNRIIWTSPTAAYDLRIVKAAWSNSTALLGETVTCKVTCLNVSTNAVSTSGIYLDLYFNLTGSPVAEQVGNQYYQIVSLPAGLPVDHIFTVSVTEPDSLGLWNSWLQIDTDLQVAESNEGNNVYGPFYVTWYNLPAIADLSIERLASTGNIRLEWSYPVACDQFNIYGSNDPYFAPGPENYITGVMYPSTIFTASPESQLFYKVTAEIITAARVEHPDPWIRNARRQHQ